MCFKTSCITSKAATICFVVNSLFLLNKSKHNGSLKKKVCSLSLSTCIFINIYIVCILFIGILLFALFVYFVQTYFNARFSCILTADNLENRTMSRLLPKFTVLNRPWRVAGRPAMAASIHLTNSQEVTKSNFKAVIFDMGGVLIPSPFEIFRGKF